MADGSAHWATVRGGGSYQIAPGTQIAVLTGVSAAAKTCVDAGKLAFLQASAAAGVPVGAAPTETDVRALTLAVEQAFLRAVAPPLDVPSAERAARAVIEPALQAALADEGIRAAADTLVTNAGQPKTRCRAGRPAADGQTLIDAMRQAVPEIGSLIPKGAMAYGGGADIAVLPGSTICLSAPVGTPAGTWTIQASDVLAQSPAPPEQAQPIKRAARHVRLVQVVPPAPPAPADAPLTQPILIDATGGAKITVTGAADMSLPQGAVISAPRRPDYPLPRPRRLLAPQGTNVIVASLGIILGVNILTMFGIGAELGIAASWPLFPEPAPWARLYHRRPGGGRHRRDPLRGHRDPRDGGSAAGLVHQFPGPRLVHARHPSVLLRRYAIATASGQAGLQPKACMRREKRCRNETASGSAPTVMAAGSLPGLIVTPAGAATPAGVSSAETASPLTATAITLTASRWRCHPVTARGRWGRRDPCRRGRSQPGPHTVEAVAMNAVTSGRLSCPAAVASATW